MFLCALPFHKNPLFPHPLHFIRCFLYCQPAIQKRFIPAAGHTFTLIISALLAGYPGVIISAVTLCFHRFQFKIYHPELLDRQRNLQFSLAPCAAAARDKRSCRFPEQFLLFLGKAFWFPHIVPEAQRITGVLIHSLCKEHIFLFNIHRETKRKFQFPPRSLPRAVKHYSPIAAILRSKHKHILCFKDAFPNKFFIKLECKEGWFWDTAVCHKPESSVERYKRDSLLLKDIPECPVGIRPIHIPKARELPGNICSILVCIMQRTIRDIGGIKLRNMNFKPLKFRETVNNIPGAF